MCLSFSAKLRHMVTFLTLTNHTKTKKLRQKLRSGLSSKAYFLNIFRPMKERFVWHFQKTDISIIRKAMNVFNWESLEKIFFNLGVNEMVSVCNTTIKNVMANFILYGTIICDDRNLSWINNRVEILIHERNSLYKDYH